MDPLNQNQPVNPMNQQANSMVPPAHEKPIGPAIGIIIIIAVIVDRKSTRLNSSH